MHRRPTPLLMAMALSLGAIAAALGQPPVVSAAFPGEDGRIVYTDTTDGSVWTVNPDGTDPRRLTTPPEGVVDWFPQWSPGGTMIAFQRLNYPVKPSEIWVMDADGGDPRVLLANQVGRDEYAPSFAPDAARITFTGDWPPTEAPLGHPRHDIYVADAGGNGVRRLTFDGVDGGEAAVSRWSPTGEWISFHSTLGIELIRPDGTGRHVLVTSGAFPSWSPDGTQIVYQFRANGVARLYVVDIETGASRILVQKSGGGGLLTPTWSPDGSTIAFVNGRLEEFGGSTIHTIPAGGGTATDVGVANADHLDWQPIPAFPLVDARFSTLSDSIEWLHEEGLTTGCAPERYCPDRAVTRGELASFLDRALDLPPTAEDHFGDDDGTTHEAAINRVAEAGLTAGCGPDAFCPSARVTRAELASFFDRAFDLPGTTADAFVDDESSTHEPSINRLAAAGIASGCAEDRFCPEAPVRRGQLAAFLKRALT